jgi:hypothetical protein
MSETREYFSETTPTEPTLSPIDPDKISAYEASTRENIVEKNRLDKLGEIARYQRKMSEASSEGEAEYWRLYYEKDKRQLEFEEKLLSEFDLDAIKTLLVNYIKKNKS